LRKQFFLEIQDIPDKSDICDHTYLSCDHKFQDRLKESVCSNVQILSACRNFAQKLIQFPIIQGILNGDFWKVFGAPANIKEGFSGLEMRK
jgi:hypothetical protein